MKIKIVWATTSVLSSEDLLKRCFNGEVPKEITWKDGVRKEIFIQQGMDSLLSMTEIMLCLQDLNATNFKSPKYYIFGGAETVFEEGDSTESAKIFLDLLLQNKIFSEYVIHGMIKELKKTRSLFASKWIRGIRLRLEKILRPS